MDFQLDPESFDDAPPISPPRVAAPSSRLASIVWLYIAGTKMMTRTVARRGAGEWYRNNQSDSSFV